MNAWLFKIPMLADWGADTVFEGLDPSKRFALSVVIIGCGTGVICALVASITSMINSIHRRRLEADMKREMLDRGMSADEIAKVIEAAAPPEDGAQRWIASWAKPRKA